MLLHIPQAVKDARVRFKNAGYLDTRMEVPVNAKTIRTKSSIVWKDAEGVMYLTPADNDPLELNTEEIREDMQKLRDFAGQEMACLIVEARDGGPLPHREQRDIIQQELNSFVKAMAIITRTALSKMTANIFFALKPSIYPVKFFTDVASAQEWIRNTCLEKVK